MKKYLSLLLALCLTLSLAACGSKADTSADAAAGSQTQDNAPTEAPAGEPVELIVFAAASMTETMNQLKEMYEQNNPNVTVTYNFDSSGKLLTQIKEGADCDLFISAAPTQMNAMDGSLIGDTEKNPDGLDRIVTGSRIDLLENKVTLAVPEGNPKGIESFDQLAELLKSGEKPTFTLLDFHAEATSEKLAMAYYLDGRVSAIWGTHTHVPTADEEVFPKGTGYLTDLGMTGAVRSVLGIKPEQSVETFLGGLPGRYREPEKSAGKMQGAIFTLDDATGLCVSVERVDVR